MHVLFIGFVWPEPKSSAAGQNILSYIETAIQNKWQLSFCSAAQTTPQTHDLTVLGVNTFEISLNCESFNQQIHKLQPNVVVFDRYLSFEQFAWRVKESVPSALLVLDAEDLHCLRSARHNLVKQRAKQDVPDSNSFMGSNDITQAKHLCLLNNDIALREITCILQADVTLVLSPFEETLLVEHFKVPANQVTYSPFILADTNIEQERAQKEALDSKINEVQKKNTVSHKQDFVFIGNFRHAPNYHAVKILAEQCWPRIYQKLHKQFPSISCHVYGAYMSPKAKQLENRKTNFLVHGFADCQFSVIKQARIMLAPISFGAGVKGKLLDAMLCKTPSITSPLGQEGISQNAWPGVVANSVDEFVEAAVHLYSEENEWQTCVDRGDEILEKEYDRAINQAHFTNTIMTKVANITDDRNTNFLQRLLGQNQFQTSKYMSQWIEAKNK